MRKVSDALPTSQRTSKLAEFIDQRLEDLRRESGMTVGQVADEAGLPQRNMLSMIRAGVTKLPFDRVQGMAQALDVEMPHLLRLALEEYQPHLEALLKSVHGHVLTQNEVKLLDLWRSMTKDKNLPIEPLLGELERSLKRTLSQLTNESRP